MLELNGHKLTTWQRGRRLYAIESQYRYLPWHPTNLFSACMRRAIYQLSSGMDRQTVTTNAVNMFIAQAKQPGLDTRYGTNTYLLAMDLCATIRTILAYLERITLVTLHELNPVPLSRVPEVDIHWSFLAHGDDSGLLHRWVFVDRIDEDAVIRELHKWETIGDIVVHQSPMMVHFIAIGQTTNGRRYSPWCRAYKSPLINNLIRFQKRKGKLTEGWTPVYLADNPNNNPDHWVDQMIEDDAHTHLMLHRTVAEPDKPYIANFYRDIAYEAQQMGMTDLTRPLELPMCRTSCDVPYICPHQTVCYSLTATFENCGLYERVKSTQSGAPKTNRPVLSPA